MDKKTNLLTSLKGKTIAIVYIFEKEDAEGFGHFLIWKDQILTGWLNAIYELECMPYIIDVRTFMQKASNYSLPHLDYVINLNSGCNELSTMGLVPSICSFLNIPCIPCDATAILASENKKISNYIAIGTKLQTPAFLDNNQNYGIYRPINLGNSIGIQKKHFTDFNSEGIYQEFIPGYSSYRHASTGYPKRKRFNGNLPCGYCFASSFFCSTKRAGEYSKTSSTRNSGS